MGGSHTEIKSRIEAAFAAIDRGDWDGFLDRVDPEIEYIPVEENVTYRGRIEMRGYFGGALLQWTLRASR